MRPPRGCIGIACVAALLTLPGARPATAEALVVSISTHRVQINSTYTGSELVIFGAIDSDRRSVTRADPYAVVVTARGPRGSIVVREKVPIGPIWANLSQRKFVEVPATLAVLASRPLDEIATPQLQRRLRLGLLPAAAPPGIGAMGLEVMAEDSFTTALIRLKREAGLYVEDPRAVTFLTPTIFRAPVPVPGTAPVGTYEVEVSLLSGGVELARETTSFEVRKVGFEQDIYSLAHRHSWLYGSLTAAMALMFGWFASLIFRRD